MLNTKVESTHTQAATNKLYKTANKQTVALQLKNLTKVFNSSGDEHVAVDNINLDVYQGEFITILGPSGCGKTTTLRMVAGFEFPTAGEIVLDGEVINESPANKRPMTMVFQSYALFPHMTVFDNIAYGLRIQKVLNLAEKVEIVTNLMNLVGLNDRMPHQLSGGQQQRVALARALVMEPRVLLFDEPLSNLDAKLRIHMRTEIRHLQQRLGITSLYVTHDQAEAMGLSDRIVVMNSGQIEQVGTPAEIYMKPASTFVADFMGRSNFIKSDVLSRKDGRLTLSFFDQTFDLPIQQYEFKTGDEIHLVIRPESVLLQPSNTDAITVEGEVKQAEYLGTHIEYEIALPFGHFISVVDWNPLSLTQFLAEGDQITLYFPLDAFHLLPQ